MRFTPGCTCCGIGGCCGCAVSPAQWRVTISGASGNFCSGTVACSVFDGVYVLDFFGSDPSSDCIWLYTFDNGCTGGGGGSTNVLVRCTPSLNQWSVDLTFPGVAVLWTKSTASWVCLGSNTLTGGAESGVGTPSGCTWPLTVTAEPV